VLLVIRTAYTGYLHKLYHLISLYNGERLFFVMFGLNFFVVNMTLCIL